MEARPARSSVARAGGALALLAFAALESGCSALAWFEPDPYENYRRQQEARWEAQNDAKRERAARSMEERIEFADDLRGTGELDRAVWAYLEAYRRDPQNPLPLERIAFVQLTEDPPRAQISFERLIEEEPQRATSHAGLGLAHYAQGQLEPARVSLERALELDPDAPLTLSGLAAVYDLLGRPQDAAAKLERLAALRPRDPLVMNNIGVSRMLQRDYAGAEQVLRRAVQIDPRNPTSWNNLGLALGHQDRFEEALEAFRKGGNEQSAQNNVGYLLYRAGRYDEAIAAYEAALLADGDQKARVLQNLQLALDAKDAPHEESVPRTADGGEPDAAPPAATD
jgi:Flp pilus assembly protein TadD